MPDKSTFSLTNTGIALGGGVAAAAVYAVLTKETGEGLVFAHLAPLPLMIVGLGFGVAHGATAALVATILLSIWPSPNFGLIYGLLVALPAFLAVYTISGAPFGRRDLVTKNLPATATLVASLAVIAAVVGWLGFVSWKHGGLAEALNPFQARLYQLFEHLAAKQQAEGGEAIDPKAIQIMVAQSLHAMPAFFAAHILLVHILNLWGAARLCKASSLLNWPWPDLASDFVLPRWVSAVFVICVAATWIDGFAGAVGFIAASTLGVALAFQGLAVLQVLLRGYVASTVVLTIIYFALGLLGWPVVLLGVAEAIFALRARKENALGARHE